MAAQSPRTNGVLAAAALAAVGLLVWFGTRSAGDGAPQRVAPGAAADDGARAGAGDHATDTELARPERAAATPIAPAPAPAPIDAGPLAPADGDESERVARSSDDTRLELVVLPSPAWLEEGAPAHLGPAVLRLGGAFAAREPYLGEWRGTGWLFQVDGLAPGVLELDLATPSAPRAAEPLRLELAAGDTTHTVALAERGRAVRVVLVWEDDSRRRVDEAFAATGVYSGLDTTGDAVPFVELLAGGVPVAVAAFEAVAPERYVYGDVFEARFDAVPDGDYDVRVACGFERHASLAPGATRVRVRMEDAYVRVPVVLDLAWRAVALPLEVLVGDGAFVPERVDVVAFGVDAGGAGRSAIQWRAEAVVADGVARFEVPADLREPRRVMLAADGAQPLFLDGAAVRLGGRLVARFQPGSGGLVLAGGRCGGRAAAPVAGLDLTWHGAVQRLDLFGALELASPAELPFDRTVLGAPDVWRARFGSRSSAPVRADLVDSGSVVFLELRP